MKKFKTVFKFTYLWNIKTKSFIFSTILGIIIVALVMNFNVIMDKLSGSSEDVVAVCDYDESFGLNEEGLNDLGFEDCNFKILNKAEISDVKEEIEDGKSDIDYLITMYSGDKEEIEVFSKSNSDTEGVKNITTYFKTMYISNRAIKSDLDSNVLNNLMADVPINLIESDEAKAGNMFMVYFLILLLYMVIMFYGMAVLNSVVEEKNNRIMETLITMAKPIELFFGKVLGVCAVTLSQIIIIVGSGLIFMNFNDSITSALESFNINFDAKLIIFFVAFILLGYLLYAFIFAALGSLVSSTQDSSQAVMPMTFFVMAIMMAGIMSLANLDSTFAVICSYVPFSAPIFMFERAILTDISVVKVIVSLVILVLSIFVIGVLSSKVYKKGVLHYGKRASFFKTLLNK